MAELDRLSHRIKVSGGRTLRDHMRRPEMTASDVMELLSGEHDPAMVDRVMIDARYEGYVQRQRSEIARRGDMDRRRIPDPMAVALTNGLRAEAAEALQRFQPSTLGQAARLAGVTPADITLLAVALHRSR
jgi:tRNA uridine 5-carboxymethylaminomethyl modification enzyme